jgi:hypothetical protein
MVTNRNDDDNVPKMQPELDAISHVGQRSADEKRADQGMTRAKTRQEQKAPRFSDNSSDCARCRDHLSD